MERSAMDIEADIRDIDSASGELNKSIISARKALDFISSVDATDFSRCKREILGVCKTIEASKKTLEFFKKKLEKELD